jgi:hypothetical protein
MSCSSRAPSSPPACPPPPPMTPSQPGSHVRSPCTLPRPPDPSRSTPSQGDACGGPPHIQTKLRTHGEDWDTDEDLRVEDVNHEEEDVEEIYGQLWVIPKPDKVRVPTSVLARGG